MSGTFFPLGIQLLSQRPIAEFNSPCLIALPQNRPQCVCRNAWHKDGSTTGVPMAAVPVLGTAGKN